MNSALRFPLNTSPAQHAQLVKLQQPFAEVCNALAPLVQQTRCWNRVALHHMAYKQLRESFPGMGSQMVCNAIYSVSRASRHIFQHPQSHFNVNRLGTRPLPRLHFLPQARQRPGAQAVDVEMALPVPGDWGRRPADLSFITISQPPGTD